MVIKGGGSRGRGSIKTLTLVEYEKNRESGQEARQLGISQGIIKAVNHPNHPSGDREREGKVCTMVVEGGDQGMGGRERVIKRQGDSGLGYRVYKGSELPEPP